MFKPSRRISIDPTKRSSSAAKSIHFHHKIIMPVKVTYIKVLGNKAELPVEFLKLLPTNAELYAAFDEDKQRLTLYAKDPSRPEISHLLDTLGELNEGLTSDEYFAPVTKEQLRRKSDRGDQHE